MIQKSARKILRADFRVPSPLIITIRMRLYIAAKRIPAMDNAAIDMMRIPLRPLSTTTATCSHPQGPWDSQPTRIK